MSIKVKGLLKGLRYISQIFDEEEEKEMQIGFPMDVKHVAHIGCEGPTTNAPSWMNEFKSPDGAAQMNIKENEEAKGITEDSPRIPKASRRKPSIDSTKSDSPLESPTEKSKELKHPRRHHSSSASKESKEANGHSRSSRHKEDSSPQDDMSKIPKKSRRKKSKDGEGSVRSSRRSKDHGSGSTHESSEEGLSRSYTGDTCENQGLVTLHEEQVKG